jgi:hypothetical protein
MPAMTPFRSVSISQQFPFPEMITLSFWTDLNIRKKKKQIKKK